jgi:hypothetical protein
MNTRILPVGGRFPRCIGLWAGVASICLMAALEARANGISAGTIYGVGVDNTIYFVDTDTKTINSVAPSLSTGVKANGFASDRGRNQLFYFGSNGDLYYYLIATGSAGTVAPASTFGITDQFPPEDASFYGDAFWYIAKGNDFNNKLYKAPLTYTGGVPSFSGTPTEYQLTVNGTSTGMAFGDIVINATTGMLYGSTTPLSGGLFFDIDVAALSTVGNNPVQVLTSGNTVGLQLAFSEDASVLFGQDYIFDVLDPTNPAKTSGQWYTVNTSLGTFSQIPGFTTTPGMRDLAGVAVPEPSTIVFAGVGLAMGVVWTSRRRVR